MKKVEKSKKKEKKEKKKVKVIYHYSKADEDCGGDYWEVEIFIDGELVQSYGDEYHEKGSDRTQGFIDALESIYGKLSIDTEHVADIDYE